MLGQNRPSNDPNFSRQGRTDPALARVLDIQRRAAQNAERNQRMERKRTAHRDAHEQATEGMNPMIPLIRSIDETTKGIRLCIESMEKTIIKVGKEIVDTLKETQIGGGGGLDVPDLSRNKRNRGPRSRGSRMLRGGAYALAGGAAAYGLASMLGFDETESAAIGTAGGVAGGLAGYIPGGSPSPIPPSPVPPGSPPGPIPAQRGFFSRMMGVANKAMVPLTVGSTLYENWDELNQTGKVNPLTQVQKAGSGLGKIFDINSPLLSMSRLEGVGDTLSGTSGAVLGVGTQIGAAVKDMIPDSFSDSIIDGVVGLFGGKTNKDREVEMKKLDEYLARKAKERSDAKAKAEGIGVGTTGVVAVNTTAKIRR